MSAFTRKPRSIAHPEWLRSALRDFKSTERLYLNGTFPKVLEFPMMAVAIHRQLRSCFRSRWAMLWWLFIDALGFERERLHGVLYRFWRYRVKMKSQDSDMNKFLSQNCPQCHNRCTFSVPVVPQTDKHILQCDGCGALSDFEERYLAADDDEDDDD